MPEINANETKANANAAISGRRNGAGAGLAAAAGALEAIVKPAHHRRSDLALRKDSAAAVALPQAAARVAACLTLPSTWPSNCRKFFSKRWATSRAALS